MIDPTDELTKHFTAREAAEQSGLTAAALRAKESADFQATVVKTLGEAIEPVMTDVRDFLLSLNYPAAVQFIRDAAPDTYGGTLSLHCSNDVQDTDKPAHQMPYFAAYKLDRGRVVFRANKASGRILRPGETVETRCEIIDLTAENANRHLIDFVKACFPI